MMNKASSSRPQRTGWVILVFMAATNFMAWMEPLVAETSDFQLLTSSRLRMSVGACVLAAALVTATWLAGRYSSTPLPRLLSRPRLLGFRLALGAGAANIIAGFAVARFGPEASLGGWRVVLLLEAIWFLLILPGEVLSSYLTGRGSVRRPVPAAEPAAPAAVQTSFSR